MRYSWPKLTTSTKKSIVCSDEVVFGGQELLQTRVLVARVGRYGEVCGLLFVDLGVESGEAEVQDALCV